MATGPQALLESFVGAVVLGLEAAAALVIVVAGTRALLHFLARTFRPASRHSSHAADRPLRHEFGRSLLLALDFTIGSDMLRVALAPSWEGAALAGLVVAVRTVLTLVLEYERRKDASEPGAESAAAGERNEGREEGSARGPAATPSDGAVQAALPAGSARGSVSRNAR